jgi:hypothetical protein
MRDPELTRRLWILGVGETALGLGFAGLMEARPSELVSLPPGLYQPLSNHLGHALESGGRFHPIPPGSPTDYVKARTGPYKPLFFSPVEFAVIRRLTELILGEESEAGNAGQTSVVNEVAEWIDLRVFSSAGTRAAAAALDQSHRAVMVAYQGPGTLHELERFDAQQVCRDGLAWLQDESKSRHNTEFLRIEERDQLQILTATSDEEINKNAQTPGTRFFELIKAEVIRGFYTSQAGLKELGFKGNAFYARSPACNRT